MWYPYHWVNCIGITYHWVNCIDDHISLSELYWGSHITEWIILRITYHWVNCIEDHISLSEFYWGSHITEWIVLRITYHWVNCIWDNITFMYSYCQIAARLWCHSLQGQLWSHDIFLSCWHLLIRKYILSCIYPNWMYDCDRAYDADTVTISNQSCAATHYQLSPRIRLSAVTQNQEEMKEYIADWK